jgi:glyoxylase-like metal-dependent hydrolase (beta-lactamase superfamily II)
MDGGINMIIEQIGHVQSNLYYLGFTECPIYLWDGPEPVIFDAGVTCAGKIYVNAIRSVLGERQPSLLCLTHVHWDHCGTAAYLKKAFPALKIAATTFGANIIKRPNALSLIRMLNDATLERIKSVPVDISYLNTDPFEPFEIDVELKDGQIIHLQDGTIIEVMSTPGHTQDHHSFWLPGKKILFAGEAAGVFYSHDTITTEFAYDYDAYLSSLLRLSALPAEIFCQGHYYILAGRDEISTFFEKSIRETTGFKDRVMELLDEEKGSVENVISRVKAELYDGNLDVRQPEATYMLNLKAKVTHLAGKRQT